MPVTQTATLSVYVRHINWTGRIFPFGHDYLISHYEAVQDEVSWTMITSAIENEMLGTVDNFVPNVAEWVKLMVVMIEFGGGGGYSLNFHCMSLTCAPMYRIDSKHYGQRDGLWFDYALNNGSSLLIKLLNFYRKYQSI